MMLSVDMATKVTATLESITMLLSKMIFDSVTGKIPIASIPTELKVVARMYHFLAEKVESTRGAQRNLKICGDNPAAIRAATCSTGKPAFVYRNASVTFTKPFITPMGRMRNVNTMGWIFFCGLCEEAAAVLVERLIGYVFRKVGKAAER